MPSGTTSSPTCPLPRNMGGREPIVHARSSTPSSTSYVVAANGDSCPTTFLDGLPSTIISEDGVLTVLGKGSTRLPRTPADSLEKKPSAQCGHCGFSVGEDYRSRRRR